VRKVIGEVLPPRKMLADSAPPAQVCAIAPDAPASVEEARAARFRGDYDSAHCALDRALAREPGDADAWVELGFLSSVTGETDAARLAFLRALEIAPDYDDAKLGLAHLAYRSGDVPVAQAWINRISAGRSNDRELRSLRRAIDAVGTPQVTWRWDTLAGYSSLSNGLAPWREASIAISRRSGRSSVGLSVERVQRFGLHDTYGEVRFSRQFSQGVWGIAFGGSSDPAFKPEAAIRFAYATPENRDTTFATALTLARYPVGQVDTLSLRATRQVAAPLQLNAVGILVRDETDELRTGYGLGAAWQAHRRLLVDVSWVDAPESSEGVTIDVRATTLGVTAKFADDFRLRVGVMREERDAFDRTEFAVSLSRTF
jgi:YaiO family outer membrane protein